jgi:lipoyl(octanoyl) transferase
MARAAWLVRPRGLVPYEPANRAMHELADRRLEGDVPDTLVLLEHEPVYTGGRRSHDEHLVASADDIRERGAELHRVDRGGSFTFHGPGQLVGYPVLDLGPRPDALRYVRRLEEAVILAGRDAGIELHRSDVQTGVWSGTDKVCAIGVRIKRMRVTLHGFAVNCSTDLRWYDAIVPCGLEATGVTSLSRLAGRSVEVDEMAPLVAHRFAEVFDVRFAEGPDEAFRLAGLRQASATTAN